MKLGKNYEKNKEVQHLLPGKFENKNDQTKNFGKKSI